MKQSGRTQRVYQAALHCFEQFSLKNPRGTMEALQVASIARQADVSPNNASTELRQLFRQGLLLRVNSRPAVYCPVELLESKLHRPVTVSEFPSVASFIEFLLTDDRQTRQSETVPFSMGLQPAVRSQFDELIGCSQSLQEPVEAVKAALLYPPNGLHTLLTGETGVGKSNFAGCMFDYARRCGSLKADADFVTFNCANYADNPQLLMSQLFGYAKGAYTGAVHDQAGLVEYADGGILFLDEIHRLHPEGQEKLFHLIDKGTFRRMGETRGERTVRTLIIGATTEPPETCMLSTFLRRIPVHVKLPSLAERSVHERLDLALYFIWKESQVMRHRVSFEREILNALIHYHCPGNIGQLQSDIKLTCANVYFHYLTSNSAAMEIKLPHLSSGIRDGLFSSRGASSRLVNENMKNFSGIIEVDGAQPFSAIQSRYLSEQAIY